MNLAEYEKLDVGGEGSNKGTFIRFEKNGETRYLRFCYESGGETMGSDIETRRKKWDMAAKKYVYDTEDGTLTCTLDCIEYDSDGSNPRRVRWERSAYFCKNTLLPMWKNYTRIIDGVWKVTVTNPGTLEASYSLFPVMNADSVKYPIIEAQEAKESAKTTQPIAAEEAPAPQPKKKYWE